MPRVDETAGSSTRHGLGPSGVVVAVPWLGEPQSAGVELGPVEFFRAVGVFAVAFQDQTEADAVVGQLERPDRDVAVCAAGQVVEPLGQALGQAVADPGAGAPDAGVNACTCLIETVQHGEPRLVRAPVRVSLEAL